MNLGIFENISALWAAYPNGGKPGDYATVGAIVTYWDDITNMWGSQAETPPYSQYETQIEDIYAKLSALNSRLSHQKGYFDTAVEANEMITYKQIGDICYIKNALSTTGYYIATLQDGIFVETTNEAPFIGINPTKYQLSEDNALPTTSKTIIGAFTEIVNYLANLPEGEGGVGALLDIIGVYDSTAPTDSNVYSALKSKTFIESSIAALATTFVNTYLKKNAADTAAERITFAKGLDATKLSKFAEGIEVGTYTAGAAGGGSALKMNVSGNSELEVDVLTVRKLATFFELMISKLSHVGGQLILSPARMTCSLVIAVSGGWKCYIQDDDGKVTNDFVVDDQARCQVFTGTGIKYYWRRVTEVGTDGYGSYIKLSDSDCDDVYPEGVTNNTPEKGDVIIQLGNRTTASRQSAQILSTVGSDAPSYKQYNGIGSGETPYSLEGKERTVFSATGNTIVGSLTITNGEGQDIPVDTYLDEKLTDAVVAATNWSINTTSPVIYKNATGATIDGVHTPITVKGELRQGTTITPGGYLTVTPNGGTEAGTATASPVEISPVNSAGKSSYTIKLYDTAAKTTLLDTMTIPVVFKGGSGINVVLSNETDVLLSDENGNNVDYTDSGTTIRVYEGAVELEYNGVGTTPGFYKVTYVENNIYIAYPSKLSNYCSIDHARDMEAVSLASIVYTITGKTTQGIDFSMVKTQTFKKVRAGANGSSAPLLYLSASSQIMKCASDNTPIAGQTIVFYPKTQNVSDTVTFEAIPYNSNSVALTPITLGTDGNNRTLTNSQWLSTYSKVVVTAHVATGNLTDIITVYRVKDGATGKDVVVGFLTNENVTISTDENGNNGDFTTAKGDFVVFDGHTKVMDGVTYNIVGNPTACSASIDAITGAYSVTAMTADSASVTFRADYLTLSIVQVFTLSKSKKGGKGDKGDKGDDGTGLPGTSIDIIYKRSATIPDTPPESPGVPAGWQTNVASATGTELLWSCIGKKLPGNANYTWALPTQLEGSPGTSYRELAIYKRSATVPATPSGQSYNFTTQILVPPSGWSVTVPTGTDPVYACRTTVWTKDLTVDVMSITWSAPVKDSLWDALNDLGGGVNLIRNGGFMNGQVEWYGNSPTPTINFYWAQNTPNVLRYAKVQCPGQTGIWQRFQNGYFDSPKIPLELNRPYTLSFIAKCDGNVTLSAGYENHPMLNAALTTSWKRYKHTFTPIDERNVSFTALSPGGTFYITNIKLETGTTATAFKNDYLEEAINGSTEINGGLVLGNVLGVKDAGGITRAYMNGLSANTTAFAAGVTNFGLVTETRRIELNHDGSGHLADQNIKWGVTGNLNVKASIEAGLTTGARTVIDNNGISIFNGSNPFANIKIGIKNGYAVLEYYDNDGVFLYDLGPGGIGKVAQQSERWENKYLTLIGAKTLTIQDVLTTGAYKTIYKSPSNNGTQKTGHLYWSGVSNGVMTNPDDNGITFDTQDHAGAKIADGIYTLNVSTPVGHPNIQENIQLTQNDIQGLSEYNEAIYGSLALYRAPIIRYLGGIPEQIVIAYWN